jgi:hypothetical protein
MPKVSFVFDPFEETGIDVPRGARAQAKADVAEYVKEQVLGYIGDGRSPVAGGPWKGSYTRAYKREKAKQSSAGTVNLEFSGEMLDALDVVNKGGTKLEIKVGGDQSGKAEGNNIGSYGRGPNESKARRFIPIGDETFRREIWKGVKNILKEYEDTGDGNS